MAIVKFLNKGSFAVLACEGGFISRQLAEDSWGVYESGQIVAIVPHLDWVAELVELGREMQEGAE